MLQPLKLDPSRQVRCPKPPKEPGYSLLGSIDSMFILRREKDLGALTGLTSHAIVDRGLLGWSLGVRSSNRINRLGIFCQER